MKGELLELIPQKYLCPKCGKWHKYTWDQNLGYYDSSDYAIEMHCPNSFGIIEVYFANDRCYWNESDQCYWCKISEFSEIGDQVILSRNLTVQKVSQTCHDKNSDRNVLGISAAQIGQHKYNKKRNHQYTKCG